MQTKVSTKGQVVLPGALRRRLGIRAGDPLDVSVDEGRIVLAPRRKRPSQIKISRDRITGIPMLTAGPDAPVLSSKEVEEMLTNFP